MKEYEINQIFDKAQARASGKVTFTPDFRRKVLEFADGFPWLAQQFGYHALDVAQSKKRSVTTVRLAEEEFDAVLPVVYDHLLKSESDVDMDVISDSKVKSSILDIISHGTHWLNADQIRHEVTSAHRPRVEAQLAELRDANVLKRDEDGRYRFANPIVRILYRIKVAK